MSNENRNHQMKGIIKRASTPQASKKLVTLCRKSQNMGKHYNVKSLEKAKPNIPLNILESYQGFPIYFSFVTPKVCKTLADQWSKVGKKKRMEPFLYMVSFKKL